MRYFKCHGALTSPSFPVPVSCILVYEYSKAKLRDAVHLYCVSVPVPSTLLQTVTFLERHIQG